MQRIWQASYPEGVPYEIGSLPYHSIGQMFEMTCALYSDVSAFSNFGEDLTFTALHEKANQFAGFLQQQCGVQKGDRVAIMMPNLLQYPIALYGALMIGAVIVNVNPLYTSRELTSQLKDSGARVLVIVSSFADTLKTALTEVSIEHVVMTDMGDCLPRWKAIMLHFVLRLKGMMPRVTMSHAWQFRTIMQESYEKQSVDVGLDDLAFLQYTGGTTGVPKAAMLSHGNLLSNMQQAKEWVQNQERLQHPIVIAALPLYHIFSLMVNCLFFFSIGAENVLVTNPKHLRSFVRLLKKKPFHVIAGVNTLFNALVHHPQFPRCDFSQLKIALGGGMAVQESVAREWQSMTGVPITQAYGLTETSPGVTINPLVSSTFTGSIGLPLPSTDIKILDKNHQEVPQGHSGELAVKGPQVMQGYWQNSQETANALTEDGYFLTGDIAVMDPEGYITIVDRLKDMINVSGFNVYPNEVEAVISEHPYVEEVAVVPVTDPVAGEVVKAVIVKKDPSLTKLDIIHLCERNLTRYKVPKRIEFVDSLPKTPVGKILRRALREGQSGD